MTTNDFVTVPAYDVQKLSVPYKNIVSAGNTEEITRKLFYSTKHLGKYDLDAGEHTGTHPGIDLKLPVGTPIGSIAGGSVYDVRENSVLGIHVLIEHHMGEEVFFSIYGHLGNTSVKKGQDVTPGQYIGNIGMTGSLTAPHLHLQVDRKRGEEPHQPYVPSSPADDKWMVNPIAFIDRY